MSGPLQRRLAELVALYGLPEGARAQLRALLTAVESDPTAPTTVTDPSVGVERHIADSLDGLRRDEVRGARTVADLGAGAGFPGLVLAVARPEAQVAVVDSVGKKAAFMRRAATAAGLENVTAVHARVEEWADGIGCHDLVTARAVAPLTTLVEYAAPLLIDGGHLVAWKGARDAAEEADGAAAGVAVGLIPVAVEELPPRPGADHRHLHVYRKVAATPPRYPRRAGMARKRPIRTG